MKLCLVFVVVVFDSDAELKQIQFLTLQILCYLNAHANDNVEVLRWTLIVESSKKDAKNGR